MKKATSESISGCISAGGTGPRPKPLVFETKDSGERATFEGGMVRDTARSKLRPDLVLDGPMFRRWVALMTRGAVKYEARNWMKAAGEAEYERFRESAVRHFMAWYDGVPDNEDHGAAVFFNINGAEFVNDSLNLNYEADRQEDAEMNGVVEFDEDQP